MKLELRKRQGEFNRQYKFGDYELYDLNDATESDEPVPIVNYRVLYFRRVSGQEKYYQAEIEYFNYHFGQENSPYLRKGYTVKGLMKLKEMLLEKGIPHIYLSINKDNLASKGVAKKAGFIDDVVFHPDALKIMEGILADLPDKELAEKEFEWFKMRYEKYMEKKRQLEDKGDELEI